MLSLAPRPSMVPLSQSQNDSASVPPFPAPGSPSPLISLSPLAPPTPPPPPPHCCPASLAEAHSPPGPSTRRPVPPPAGRPSLRPPSFPPPQARAPPDLSPLSGPVVMKGRIAWAYAGWLRSSEQPRLHLSLGPAGPVNCCNLKRSGRAAAAGRQSLRADGAGCLDRSSSSALSGLAVDWPAEAFFQQTSARVCVRTTCRTRLDHALAAGLRASRMPYASLSPVCELPA